MRRDYADEEMALGVRRARAHWAHECLELLEHAEAVAGKETELGKRIHGYVLQLDDACHDGAEISDTSARLCMGLVWEAALVAERSEVEGGGGLGLTRSSRTQDGPGLVEQPESRPPSPCAPEGRS